MFGPIGKDGYFEPLFNKRTGEINREVAKYWKEHYDLRYHLEKNWTTLGPKLVDKLYFYTGDVDTYYLNNSTKELEQWMKKTENPHYEGFFMYGDDKPHCWSGPVTSSERLKEMAQLIMRKKPEGATTPWWTTDRRDSGLGVRGSAAHRGDRSSRVVAALGASRGLVAVPRAERVGRLDERQRAADVRADDNVDLEDGAAVRALVAHPDRGSHLPDRARATSAW